MMSPAAMAASSYPTAGRDGGAGPLRRDLVFPPAAAQGHALGLAYAARQREVVAHETAEHLDRVVADVGPPQGGVPSAEHEPRDAEDLEGRGAHRAGLH